MAWYLYLAVECEQPEIARQIATAFCGQRIRAANRDVTLSRIESFAQNGRWHVHVMPAGLGANGPGSAESELSTKVVYTELREQLFAILRPLSGYRRAWFYGEAGDLMAFSTDPNDFMDFDRPHLVVDEQLLAHIPLREHTKPFSKGYLRVVNPRWTGRSLFTD